MVKFIIIKWMFAPKSNEIQQKRTQQSFVEEHTYRISMVSLWIVCFALTSVNVCSIEEGWSRRRKKPESLSLKEVAIIDLSQATCNIMPINQAFWTNWMLFTWAWVDAVHIHTWGPVMSSKAKKTVIRMAPTHESEKWWSYIRRRSLSCL